MLRIQHPNGKQYEVSRDDYDRWYARRGFRVLRDYDAEAAQSALAPDPPHIETEADDEPDGDEPEGDVGDGDGAEEVEAERPDIPPPSQLERRSVDWLRNLAAAYDVEHAQAIGKGELVEILTVMRTPVEPVNAASPDEGDES